MLKLACTITQKAELAQSTIYSLLSDFYKPWNTGSFNDRLAESGSAAQGLTRVHELSLNSVRRNVEGDGAHFSRRDHEIFY